MSMRMMAVIILITFLRLVVVSQLGWHDTIACIIGNVFVVLLGKSTGRSLAFWHFIRQVITRGRFVFLLVVVAAYSRGPIEVSFSPGVRKPMLGADITVITKIIAISLQDFQIAVTQKLVLLVFRFCRKM
jgi:hypothetical protein